MRTPTSLKGHPLHPILVALPIGPFVFSLNISRIRALLLARYFRLLAHFLHPRPPRRI